VLNSLPERVKVYPTENYYYFSFAHNGARYTGNIRLDASTRDLGKLDFAYSEQLSEWRDEAPVIHRLLDRGQGVAVEQLEPLVYRVGYGGKSVVFALNDLSDVKPPASALAPDENFIGPVFDDSAIRFFLVYNSRLKLFLYILDETVRVPEDFFAVGNGDRIMVGKRTGFAFYRDRLRERKILVGVHAHNQRVNNYFDGPFDQLPDNFLQGDTLRDIILQLEPSLKGQIDRFGGSFDGRVRYMIAPYVTYSRTDELAAVQRCAANPKMSRSAYYRCFVAADETGAPGKRRAASRKSAKPAPRP
jgi:hypothetical protein